MSASSSNTVRLSQPTTTRPLGLGLLGWAVTTIAALRHWIGAQPANSMATAIALNNRLNVHLAVWPCRQTGCKHGKRAIPVARWHGVCFVHIVYRQRHCIALCSRVASFDLRASPTRSKAIIAVEPTLTAEQKAAATSIQTGTGACVAAIVVSDPANAPAKPPIPATHSVRDSTSGFTASPLMAHRQPAQGSNSTVRQPLSLALARLQQKLLRCQQNWPRLHQKVPLCCKLR